MASKRIPKELQILSNNTNLTVTYKNNRLDHIYKLLIINQRLDNISLSKENNEKYKQIK